MSELEETLAWLLQAQGIPFTRQYRAIQGRRWRWDFAWPEARLLGEVQGGIWKPHTGHTSGTGLTRDYEKHNAATLAGWRVLYVTGKMIADGSALRMILEAGAGGN